MMTSFLISIFFLFLSNLIMMLTMILAKKSISDREKCSPFECGFDPKSLPRIPFSLHFFLITVIFLIFDVEIVLIFPMISTFLTTNLYYWFMMGSFFIIILLVGIYHEWNQKMLNWTY